MNSLSGLIHHFRIGCSLANRKTRATTRWVAAGHQAHPPIYVAPAVRAHDLHVCDPTAGHAGKVPTVRIWDDDEGWGVVDCEATPGRCWVHFSHIAVAGYRRLRAGQRVQLEWEGADQDGYGFRALRVWPASERPADSGTVHEQASSAYRSNLTIRRNDQ